MAKITYANKVAGAAAPTGKFSAVDANEIKTSVNNLYDEKVDIETGKGLSTNDFTDLLETKLNGIEPGAQINAANTVIDASYVHTDNNLTTNYKNLLDFNTTASSAYNTEIPFNKALTVMAGKTLTSNDTFTILAAPVNDAACKLVLVGNGSNIPVFTVFDEITGEYDATLNVKNVILFYRSESVNYVVISQTASV